MDMHQTSNLIASASAPMERFERRTQQIESSLGSALHQLQQVAEHVPQTIHQAANAEMKALRGNVASAVDAGIAQSAASYEERLRTSGQLVHQASHLLSTQLEDMRQLYRHMLWKAAGICLASLALIIVGGTWLSSHYYGEVRRYQLAAELLKAYDAADVTLCEGRLCANVDARGETFGDKQQYRAVRDRP